MLRTAVIGAGYLGRHHARVYCQLAQDTGGVELAVVCDSDIGRAREVAETYGARPCADYREILGIVDAVSIVTPTISHFGIAADCLMAGKDILLEKPVCATLDEARKLSALAAEKGLILQAGHIERFNPAAEKVLPLLNRPVFIEAERISPFPERSLDVDVTLDVMIHDIDFALHVFGCPGTREIRAAGASIVTSKLDTAKAWVDFDNGCSAFFNASRIAAEKRRTMKFIEEGKLIEADFFSKRVTIRTSGHEEHMDAGPAEPLKEELKDFIRCVKNRTAPRVSPREAECALELALKISETIRSAKKN